MENLEAVVIGGSAGALDALGEILPALPATYRLPILLVIHVPASKPSYLVDVLGRRSALPVKEAEDKEPIAPGTIYVAPPNYHLLVERGGTIALSVDEPVWFSRPAIDVLFESAADAYRGAVAGVLLTGASEDGALGLGRIAAAGGVTVAQDPETAAARTMPQTAIARGRVDRVLCPTDIGEWLARLEPRHAKELEAR